MAWNISTSTWWIIAGVAAGLTGLAILRPWRFWWSCRHCPQCQSLLPRWDCWGWKVSWACSRCGCEISR